MAYLIASEITTHLYGELQTTISRGDATKMDTAIKAAISEAIGYLNKYDIPAILAAVDDARNPILLLYIKDIAVWHFINLANPNVDMDHRLMRYEKALDWLLKVQKGVIVPDLPLPAPDVDNPQLNSTVRWGNSRTRIKGYL